MYIELGGFQSLSPSSRVSSIIAVLPINPFFSALISSVISGESSLIIILPEPVEVFNRTLDNYTYYAEILAIVPDGIAELVKTKVGSGVPMIKLTIKDLRELFLNGLNSIGHMANTGNPLY